MIERGEVVREWRIDIVPIDTIEPHPMNFRDHDLGAIHASIDRFGLYLPILVQSSTRYILAGTGRWHVLRQRGDREVPVRWHECSDEEAAAILLADNWIGRRGSDETDELLTLMRALREEDEALFAATGADDDDIADLEREIAKMGKPLDSRKMVQKLRCPSCGHEWTKERR